MTIAIFGAGGVGLMALLGAVCAGATAIVVDPLEHKRQLARELGAALTIDPNAGDPGAQINEAWEFWAWMLPSKRPRTRPS